MAALPLSLVGALLLLYAHALPARSQSRPLTLQKHFQKVAPDPRQLPRSFFDVTHFAKCPKNHYRLVLKWQGVKGCVRCPAGRTRAASVLETELVLAASVRASGTRRGGPRAALHSVWQA